MILFTFILSVIAGLMIGRLFRKPARPESTNKYSKEVLDFELSQVQESMRRSEQMADENSQRLKECIAEEDRMWAKYQEQYQRIHGRPSLQIHFARIEAIFGDHVQSFIPKPPPRIPPPYATVQEGSIL